MKRDLESRRLAIIRALRGRDPRESRTARESPPTAAAPPPDLLTLKGTVSDLASRVDELSRDLAGLRSATPIRHHIPETPHVEDDDEPVTRVSVPPVTAAKISDHALDVLLGRP